jgi:hypothetical protein
LCSSSWTISSCSYFVYSDMTSNFYTDHLWRISLLHYLALVHMAHDGPCLRTSSIGNTDTCLHPSTLHESGKLDIAGCLPQLL